MTVEFVVANILQDTFPGLIAKDASTIATRIIDVIEADDPSADVGIKHDDDKPRTDLLPVRPLLDIANVLAFGAHKYSDRNWEKGFTYSRVYGALLRHVFAWWGGEDVDKETEMSHLAHAGCCLLFLLEFLHTNAGTDDRPSS